ncbi:hypothetical protein FOA52_006243 [Chlamydomonas sp. UWO 241]|nr:hypothetical protein FOA52_006243 [Chlamydomonas sp. UWO 241]
MAVADPIRGRLAVNDEDAQLVSVTCIKYRGGLWAHHVWPFLVIYAAIIFVGGGFASRYQWFEFMCCSYALGVFAGLQVLAFLFTHWSVGFKRFATTLTVRSLDDAHGFFVVPSKYVGAPELVNLTRRRLREGLKETVELGFEFRKQRYVIGDDKVVEKLAYPAKDTFEAYMKWTGHGTDQKTLAAHDKYGLNKVEVPLPPFGDLLKVQLIAPFFVFQVFCVLLWMLDDYWYYSAFTLFMLVSFECTTVWQRLRNLKELRTMQTPKQKVQVYRCGKWLELEGEGVLVGDVISIGRPSGKDAEDRVVPCDCLLLAGNCIVEEAVLTGESTPQWKVSVAEEDQATSLDAKLHKGHMLFAGTRVLQHTGSTEARLRTPDSACLAAVVRTGYETSQGRLMRTILFSAERISANTWEAGAFILFLLCFALAAGHYVLTKGLEDPNRDRFKLVLNCVMIITSVIPPELPMELSMAVNASLVALQKKRVFCTEPFRIPFAGKVDVCCFDKTGTLTSDHLLLDEVVGPGKGDATDLVMAGCQSLVLLEGTDVVGDPLEKAGLEACGWTFGDGIVTAPGGKRRARLFHRYHFNSNLKRMTTLVSVDSGNKTPSNKVALMKGAPEVVKQHLVSVPANYDALYKSYAVQGARVISLASRQLPSSMDEAACKAMVRDEAEAGMEWAGFAIFQCPLKPESEPALRALAESSHQLVMITGDAPLTACYAASHVHIVTRDVLILSHREEDTGHVHGVGKHSGRLHEDSEYQWVSPDEATVVPFSRNFDDLLRVACRYDLAVSGDALSYMERIGCAKAAIPLCQVFARTSPEQKELVLVTLKEAGRITLMCGDGTNDVGGLKAAHVGVALLSPSESAEKLAKQRKEDREKEEAKALKAAAKAEAKVAKAGAPALPPLPDAPDGSAADSSDIAVPPPPPPLSTVPLGKGAQMLAKMRAEGKPVPANMEKWAKWMDNMEAEANAPDGMTMLKPGDASMASPFTAKASSVAPCTDIIKQGRCTLVTTVQMFKILGLLCLSTAYALSVMYLEGVKLSDAQATLNGMLTAGMFFFISQAKPLDKLSPMRPHASIFTPYFFISLLGQFATSLSVLVYMYNAARAEMPADDRLTSNSTFKPNLVNSVCYLVEASVQLSTFSVNYVGHPFNISIRDNKGMAVCVFYMFCFLGVITFDLLPGLADQFGLVEIPMHLKLKLVALCLAQFAFNFVLERAMRMAFPGPLPPFKGYQFHAKRLQQLGLPLGETQFRPREEQLLGPAKGAKDKKDESLQR